MLYFLIPSHFALADEEKNKEKCAVKWTFHRSIDTVSYRRHPSKTSLFLHWCQCVHSLLRGGHYVSSHLAQTLIPVWSASIWRNRRITLLNSHNKVYIFAQNRISASVLLLSYCKPDVTDLPSTQSQFPSSSASVKPIHNLGFLWSKARLVSRTKFWFESKEFEPHHLYILIFEGLPGESLPVHLHCWWWVGHCPGSDTRLCWVPMPACEKRSSSTCCQTAASPPGMFCKSVLRREDMEKWGRIEGILALLKVLSFLYVLLVALSPPTGQLTDLQGLLNCQGYLSTVSRN